MTNPVVGDKRKNNTVDRSKTGRAKGTPNKMTKTAKEAIELAAEGLGGVDRMILWAKEDPLNERAFWATIYPKLLPLQVNADVKGGVILTLSRVDAEL